MTATWSRLIRPRGATGVGGGGGGDGGRRPGVFHYYIAFSLYGLRRGEAAGGVSLLHCFFTIWASDLKTIRLKGSFAV